MSLSKDLARRRALLHAAELLQDVMDVGGYALYGEGDGIEVGGYPGMTPKEGEVQNEAIRELMDEFTRRAGITTMALERGGRGALRVPHPKRNRP